MYKIFLFLIVCAAGPAEAASGELVWGSDAEGGAPYVYPDPENPDVLIGFEVDLAQALAREMSLRARQFQIDWSSLIPGLLRGDYALAMNGIERTEARAREVAFSRPYYIYAQQLVVRQDETRIDSFEDIAGMRVATLEGTAAHDLLKRTAGVDIAVYEGQVEPYRDLELGRVDAVLLDTPIAAHYARGHPKLRYAGPPVGEGVYAIALRKQDTELLTQIDRALLALWRSGELKTIYTRWGLWNADQERLFDPARQPVAVSAGVDTTRMHVYLPLLLKGAGMTVLLSVTAMVLAIIWGLLLCLMRLAGGPLLKPAAVAAIEILRGTPLLLQLYIIYYGLPSVGIRLDAFTAAVLGLGLNYAAYEAEIYRSGLQSIPSGQREAALSLGMAETTVYRRILIPQSIRVVLPPVTNDFVSLFKDSSLVSIIAIVELTKAYNMLAVSSLRFLELGLLTAALYLTMSVPLSLLSTRMERQLKRHDRRPQSA